MSVGDFLRKDAQTPLTEHYVSAGVVCAISTNLEEILDAARESFCPAELPSAEPGLSFRFWVDPKGTTQPPWPKPFFRGLGDLIFAGFDAQSSVLIDLQSRRALGRFSPVMGADRTYWKTVILPVLISIMGASVGIAELHCASVARDGNGLLLAGPSGSGKSTLALALARAGFGYVSDDRTFCSEWDGRLTASGLLTLLKLRPESAEMFEEFHGLDPIVAMNGERAFLIDPDHQKDFERVKRCDPRWLVFLEQREKSGFDLAPMPPAEAAIRLEEDLIAEACEAANLQRRLITKLVKLPCWRLRYGASPQLVAEELARHFEKAKHRSFSRTYAEEEAGKKRAEIKPTRHDPLRRFTPTPYVADLPLMGRTIRLETNSPAIFERTRGLFARYQIAPSSHPDFRWRIISESGVRMKPPWPEISAFSAEGLRFINIGQRNFIAVDLDTRQAIGLLAEGLAENETGFLSPFLDDMFYLTAGGLGLVPLSTACVAFDGKGILVFGSPNSGKTTSSYIAGRSGLEFFADQAVFLEIVAGQMRAWGDFLPAVFRPETVQLLPELRKIVRPFHYLDFTFLYADKNSSHAKVARPVEPIACVFLERPSSPVPNLAPLSRDEFRRRLTASLPFKDDQRFEPRYTEVLEALEELPSYIVALGSNPAAGASIYRSLLLGHHLQAAGR